MKCNQCGYENQDNGKFCMGCGTSLKAQTLFEETQPAETPAKSFDNENMALPISDTPYVAPEAPTTPTETTVSEQESVAENAPYTGPEPSYQPPTNGGNVPPPPASPNQGYVPPNNQQPMGAPQPFQPNQGYQPPNNNGYMPPNQQPNPPKKSSNKGIVVLIVVIVIVAITLVGILISTVSKKPKSSTETNPSSSGKPGISATGKKGKKLEEEDQMSWAWVEEGHNIFLETEKLALNEAKLSPAEIVTESIHLENRLNSLQEDKVWPALFDSKVTKEQEAYYDKIDDYLTEIHSALISFQIHADISKEIEPIPVESRKKIKYSFANVKEERNKLYSEVLPNNTTSIMDDMELAYFDVNKTYPTKSASSSSSSSSSTTSEKTPSGVNKEFNEESFSDFEMGLLSFTGSALTSVMYSEGSTTLEEAVADIEMLRDGTTLYIRLMDEGDTPQEKEVMRATKSFLQYTVDLSDKFLTTIKNGGKITMSDVEQEIEGMGTEMAKVMLARKDLFVSQGYSESEAIDKAVSELEKMTDNLDELGD